MRTTEQSHQQYELKSFFSKKCDDLSEWTLHRLIENLPDNPFVSKSKHYTTIVKNTHVHNYEYAQINSIVRKSWIVVDVDGEKASRMMHPETYSNLNLPAPNLVLQRKSTGHCQLFYAIEPVFTFGKALKKPQAYLKWVTAALTKSIPGGDLSFKGNKSWNPLNNSWRKKELHTSEYSLSELMESLSETAIEETRTSSYARTEIPLEDHVSEGGRHDAIYNHLRHYAYPRVKKAKEYMTEDQWKSHLLNKVKEINNEICHPPLPESSEKFTAKSVANWTWNKYTGNGKLKGQMKLPEEMPLLEKQQASAKRTHAQVKSTTLSAIEEAVITLIEKGKKITYKAIAEEAKRHPETVSKYKQQIKVIKERIYKEQEDMECKKKESIEAELKKPISGVHQVSELLDPLFVSSPSVSFVPVSNNPLHTSLSFDSVSSVPVSCSLTDTELDSVIAPNLFHSKQ